MSSRGASEDVHLRIPLALWTHQTLLRSTGNCEALRDWVEVWAERLVLPSTTSVRTSEEATVAFWDKKVSIQKVKSRGQEVR